MHPMTSALLELELARRHAELHSDFGRFSHRLRTPAVRRHQRSRPALSLVLRG